MIELQNVLRSFTRNLFIPTDIITIISLNVTVENSLLSCWNCVDGRRLGQHYRCINTCQHTQKNTRVKGFYVKIWAVKGLKRISYMLEQRWERRGSPACCQCVVKMSPTVQLRREQGRSVRRRRETEAYKDTEEKRRRSSETQHCFQPLMIDSIPECTSTSIQDVLWCQVASS